MNIIVVGLSHKTAPVELRERLSFPPKRLGEALLGLKSCENLDEGVLLSTCNRVEVVAAVRETQSGFDTVGDFLMRHAPETPPEQLRGHLYFYEGSDAIAHVFRVASSLDSMIVGEPQILGQLKSSFDNAMVHKTTGVVLNKLFKKAISTAKRIRTETKIAETPVSVSSVASELAEKIFGSLQGVSALMIGAGEMATLAARHLVSRGLRRVFISTRTYERAASLAQHFSGTAVRFEEVPEMLAHVDVVIASTEAPHALIHPEMVKRIMPARKGRPLFFIDISVPRNVDPAVNDLDGVFLYNIDDLQTVVQTNIEGRRREAEGAERIVKEEVLGMGRWLKSLDVVPTIVAIRERAEEIRKQELEKSLGRLGRLSEAERSLVDGLTQAIVNKLLHGPVTVLKEEVGSTNGNQAIETARKLFQLEEDRSTLKDVEFIAGDDPEGRP